MKLIKTHREIEVDKLAFDTAIEIFEVMISFPPFSL